MKYTAVNDFGTVINPMLVEGQIHGGVVQGIGQALMENAVYDADGQLLTGSFMDYAMPRAHDAPDHHAQAIRCPTKTNPLGAKGCGEAGCVRRAAVGDERGRSTRSPITASATSTCRRRPPRVWQAIQDAKQGA